MVKWNLSFLTRKKIVNEETLAKSQLNRVMSMLDVTAIGKLTKALIDLCNVSLNQAILIGISSTLGSGIYVLAGSVITKYTGPSIILSFLLAGFATFFSGINLFSY